MKIIDRLLPQDKESMNLVSTKSILVSNDSERLFPENNSTNTLGALIALMVERVVNR
jgi:hypothetical protein